MQPKSRHETYDDAGLAMLGQAFQTVLTGLKNYDPFSDWDRDDVLRTVVAKRLLALPASSLADPDELLRLVLEVIPRAQNTTLSVRAALSDYFGLGRVAQRFPAILIDESGRLLSTA